MNMIAQNFAANCQRIMSLAVSAGEASSQDPMFVMSIDEELYLVELKLQWLKAVAAGQPFDITEVYEDEVGYGGQAALAEWQQTMLRRLAH